MKSIQARFLAKVRMGASCWIWIGAKNPAGYGQLRIKSAMGGFRISLAHRLSYELYVGPIPTGLVVMHSCDTPSCVNPAHLSVGTQADNLRDAGTKGRMSRGRKSHCPNGHA
nr:HNH endonuclease [Gemmatimonadaceae bacterium]